MINWQSILPLMQQGAKGVQGMFGGMPDYLKNLPAPQAGGAPQPQAQPEKTPWLQQQGFGGLQRGELLLAGMGMLGGRNFSEGLANTSGTLYGAMGRQSKEAEERKKREALLKAMTAGGMSPQQAEALAQFDPSIAFGQMNRAQDLEIDTARYNKGEEWKEKQWLRDQQRWETDQEWQQRIYDREGEQFDQTFGLSQAQFEEGKRQFGLNYGLDARGVALAERKADQEASAPGLDFGDVYRIRSANEKAIEPFAAAQRQYLMMEDLAKDGTGASDVALGFAFFKTIDPTSTVREGEFAQAASSMGLGANIVQMFKRLDKGEKFSPQLRNELVAAAGRAYNQQKTDIENLVNRETEFATRMNVDPSLVIRDPVRSNQMPGLTPVTPTPAAPPVGTIERGDDGQLYRLRGGDPSDPNSWEPLPASDTGFRFFNNPGVR